MCEDFRKQHFQPSHAIPLLCGLATNINCLDRAPLSTFRSIGCRCSRCSRCSRSQRHSRSQRRSRSQSRHSRSQRHLESHAPAKQAINMGGLVKIIPHAVGFHIEVVTTSMTSTLFALQLVFFVQKRPTEQVRHQWLEHQLGQIWRANGLSSHIGHSKVWAGELSSSDSLSLPLPPLWCS